MDGVAPTTAEVRTAAEMSTMMAATTEMRATMTTAVMTAAVATTAMTATAMTATMASQGIDHRNLLAHFYPNTAVI